MSAKMSYRKQLLAIAAATALLSGQASLAQAPQPSQDPLPANGQGSATIRVNTELVLVNVIARDKKGNLVRDLKKEDFTLLEDNKKQEISTFDFENVDELAAPGKAEATVSGLPGKAQSCILRNRLTPLSLTLVTNG